MCWSGGRRRLHSGGRRLLYWRGSQTIGALVHQVCDAICFAIVRKIGDASFLAHTHCLETILEAVPHIAICAALFFQLAEHHLRITCERRG